MTFAWGRATIYEHLSWGFGLPILCLRRVPFLCPDPLGRTDLIGLGQSLLHPTSTTFDGVCFKSGPYSITYPLPPYPLPSSIGREPDDRSKLGCGACGGAFSRRRERRTPLGPAPKIVSDAVGKHLAVEKLLRVIVCPPFRGSRHRFCSVLGWILSILALFWTTDRSDGDFFNKLVRPYSIT